MHLGIAMVAVLGRSGSNLMPIQIPFQPSVADYRLETDIEGVPYLFDVRWNSRDAAWYFDVSEIDETQIAVGIKVVLGCYLGVTRNHTLFRDGVFVAVDLSGNRQDAGYDDLGARVQVRRYLLTEFINASPAVPDVTEAPSGFFPAP